MVNLSVGNVNVPISHVFGSLMEKIGIQTDLKISEVEYHVVYNIRFPRAVYSCLIGSGLAVSGAALQGIFRNPLVDSALIGISTGASLFASLFILFSGLVPWLIIFSEGLSLSIVAFLGAYIKQWRDQFTHTDTGRNCIERTHCCINGFANLFCDRWWIKGPDLLDTWKLRICKQRFGLAIGCFHYCSDDPHLLPGKESECTCIGRKQCTIHGLQSEND